MEVAANWFRDWATVRGDLEGIRETPARNLGQDGAQSRAMKFNEGELAALLERYTCAMAAHNRCLTALIDALTNDATRPQLVADERLSHGELIAARERLIFALALGGGAPIRLQSVPTPIGD